MKAVLLRSKVIRLKLRFKFEKLLSHLSLLISTFLTIISIFPVCVKLRGIFIQYCTGNGDLNIVLCHEPGRYKISSFTE